MFYSNLFSNFTIFGNNQKDYLSLINSGIPFGNISSQPSSFEQSFLRLLVKIFLNYS